jgi:hypothetical protein
MSVLFRFIDDDMNNPFFDDQKRHPHQWDDGQEVAYDVYAPCSEKRDVQDK